MIPASELRGAHRSRARLALLAPRHWPTWLGVGVLRASLSLPLAARLWFGARLGDLYYAANAKRRRIAAINIALCFPALDAGERARLVRGHFRRAAQAIFYIALFWWGSERALDRVLTVRGLEHYERARAAGQPVITLHGHVLALEASLVLSRYFPHVGFMKPLKNPVLDHVMTRGRERFGGRVFARAGGLKPLIRALKAGFGASYIPDEDLGPKDSVFAPFFGIPAATLPTLGRLARLTNAVVLPCFARLCADGRCELWLEPPMPSFPTAGAETDAAAMNAVLERAVRTMPEQYLWTMKRFKTREDGAALYE